MKLIKEEAKRIRAEIISRQSFLLTTVGSLAGLSVGFGVFIIFALLGGIPIVTLFFPAFTVGFGAKFIGKPFEFKYRVIPGIFGMLTFVIGLYFIFTTDLLFLALTPINFLVSYYFSKTQLSKLEESAVWQAEYE